MKLTSRTMSIGMNCQETIRVLRGVEFSHGKITKELIFNVDNGNGTISIHYGSCVEHKNVHTDSLKVVISGGNMRETEYSLRTMELKAIYEVIRDGFTVELSEFNEFVYKDKIISMY